MMICAFLLGMMDNCNLLILARKTTSAAAWLGKKRERDVRGVLKASGSELPAPVPCLRDHQKQVSSRHSYPPVQLQGRDTAPLKVIAPS